MIPRSAHSGNNIGAATPPRRASRDASQNAGDDRAASAFDAARDAYDLLAEPMARQQYDSQREFRLKEKRKEKKESSPPADDSLLGKIWRRKSWAFAAWVVVKTLLA